MKKKITKICLGITLALSTLAVPAHADAILAFSGNTTGGTVTVNGSNTVTAISNVPYTELVVGSNTYGVSSGALNLSGSTLTLSGDITSLGINSPVSLLTIVLGSSLTNTGGASILNVGINNAISVTESATLLSDLGITGPFTSSLQGGGLIGSGGSGTFSVTSDTLAVIVATPEPASLSLLAVGLLGLALFVCSKSSRRVRL